MGLDNVIWNAFNACNKKHIIITGSFNSGKTRLLCAMLGENNPGLRSYSVPWDGVFMQNTATGETVRVGMYNDRSTGQTRRMTVDEEAFNKTAVDWLDTLENVQSKWVYIDEIGYLEDGCEAYHKAVKKLMEHKQLILVLRKENLDSLNEYKNREDTFVVDLDMPFPKVGSILMASGMSRRFGENKLLALYKGRTLIESALDMTEGVCEKNVVVTRFTEVEDLCKAKNRAYILHDLPDRNDTVKLGMSYMDGMDFVIFCMADQPFLKRETFIALILCAINEPQYIYRVAYKQCVGAPMIFPRRYFKELLELPAKKGGNYVANKYPHDVRIMQVQNERELIDIDTKEDLIF